MKFYGCYIYAIILFHSSADRDFITPSFKQLLNHDSSKLDVAYEVEVAITKLPPSFERPHIVCQLNVNEYWEFGHYYQHGLAISSSC